MENISNKLVYMQVRWLFNSRKRPLPLLYPIAPYLQAQFVFKFSSAVQIAP